MYYIDKERNLYLSLPQTRKKDKPAYYRVSTAEELTDPPTKLSPLNTLSVRQQYGGKYQFIYGTVVFPSIQHLVQKTSYTWKELQEYEGLLYSVVAICEGTHWEKITCYQVAEIQENEITLVQVGDYSVKKVSLSEFLYGTDLWELIPNPPIPNPCFGYIQGVDWFPNTLQYFRNAGL